MTTLTPDKAEKIRRGREFGFSFMLIICLIAAIVWGDESQGQTYEDHDNPYWPVHSVWRYRIDFDCGDATVEAVEHAFSVANYFTKTQRGADRAVNSIGRNHVSEVVCVDQLTNNLAYTPPGTTMVTENIEITAGAIIGRATFWFNSGRINEVDIELLHEDELDALALTSLPAIVLHEVGHGLGCTHSQNPRAVMYRTIILNLADRYHWSDIQYCLNVLYPTDKVISDYRGNLWIPAGTDLLGNETWGVVRNYEIVDSGEVVELGQ